MRASEACTPRLLATRLPFAAQSRSRRRASPPVARSHSIRGPDALAAPASPSPKRALLIPSNLLTPNVPHQLSARVKHSTPALGHANWENEGVRRRWQRGVEEGEGWQGADETLARTLLISRLRVLIDLTMPCFSCEGHSDALHQLDGAAHLRLKSQKSCISSSSGCG